MKKIKGFVDTILQWFCIAIVAVMAVLVTYQVVTRYVFNNPSAISEALARYLFVWLTMYGGAYVFGKRDHMNLSFVRDRFSPKIKLILMMVSEFLIAIFAFSVMIIGGKSYTLQQMIQLDPSMQIPMGYIYSSLPIAGVLILFYFICNELELFRQLKR
ncbi:MAG: TRAP transporter small permease [Elusimicrobiota bacterium]|jgi:TRAP-type C4-dicarboxylate transport system permease small subunit|nr:TRAP transporter small permease [Elusimicrobiota bacterium]